MSQNEGSIVFTFGGGAWYHAFYFGIGAALAELSADRTDPSVRFCGVSSGSLVASSLAYQLDLKEMFESALSTLPHAGKNPFKVVRSTVECIQRVLPNDEDIQRVSNQKRLLIGVSRQNRILLGFRSLKLTAHSVCQFRDREHAVAVQSASVHIPILGGFRGVLIDGERYFDGQLTQNWSCLPLFDDLRDEVDCVVRVTAYHADEFNELRRGWITPRIALPAKWQLFPPSADALRLLWRLGYLRAIEYINFSEDAQKLSSKFSQSDAEARSRIPEQLQQVVLEIQEAASKKA